MSIWDSFFNYYMKGTQKSNDWSLTDKEHWAKTGWLKGKKPW